MTRNQLLNAVFGTVLALAAFGGVGALLVQFEYWGWYKFFKDIIPVGIAIPVAYLAYCFQRRISYLQAMRALWADLIPAIQTVIQYTHLQQPTASDFSKVSASISGAIDSLRAVFANIPMAGLPTGLFPYENLKDIEKIVSWLSYMKKRSDKDRQSARLCIVRLWQEMYNEMLLEFDRSPPIRGVSKFLNKEPKSLADLLLAEDLKPEDLKWGNHPPSNPRG